MRTAKLQTVIGASSILQTLMKDARRGLHSLVGQASVRQAGHNYALYDQCTAHSLRMRVGFPVSERFTSTALVKCEELLPGQAAHAVHVGPYSDLSRTYQALHTWCAESAVALTGESWEVYGDWTDDQSKLETGLFLRSEA